MLGPLTVRLAGVTRTLPASRKVRALFAYLALAPRAVERTRLCDLLWDVPNDPRGELRWCLSKIRRVIDEPARRRVQTRGDAIALDLADCFVDVMEVARATQAGIETLDSDQLRALARLFVGEFLDGLEMDRSPYFNRWLVAQRRRLRACQAAVLEHLVRSLPTESDEVLDYLDTWLELAPLDQRAHAFLLSALARRGRVGEGEEHLAATAKLFEAEGLDWTPLREAWRAARGRPASVSPAEGATFASCRLALPTDAAGNGTVTQRRASIAVMPFSTGRLGMAREAASLTDLPTM